MQSDELRQRGNDAFREKDFQRACQLYSEALDAEETGPGRAVILCNRSKVWEKTGDVTRCLEDAEAACRADPTSVKAHYRRGTALSLVAQHHSDALRSGTEYRGPHLTIFEALLGAQESLSTALELKHDREIATALSTARDKALHSDVRGSVEVRRTATHGIGLVATAHINPGETVLEEDPVAYSEGGDWRERGQKVVEQVLAADPVTRSWVLGLHDPAGDATTDEEKLFCIWHANGHNVGDIDFRIAERTSNGVALFIGGSRVNHSCKPNAVQTFTPTGRIRIKSLVPIRKGDEVFITYCAPYSSRRERREKLQFPCNCARCQEPSDPLDSADREVADKLQRELKALDDLSGNTGKRPEAAAAAKGLESRAVELLGEDHTVTFQATLLRVKIGAFDGPSADLLPSIHRLHSLAKRWLPQQWPLLISTHLYLAVHEGLVSEGNEEHLLPHLNSAFAIYCNSMADAEDDDRAASFWHRYRQELELLDIDSCERARMLFHS